MLVEREGHMEGGEGGDRMRRIQDGIWVDKGGMAHTAWPAGANRARRTWPGAASRQLMSARFMQKKC